jgi:diacylglycerol diphosphate phosphatase/phosphatidate phosphatase
MSFFIPFAVFLICAIRVRSFWDLNNSILGVLYALIGAAVFQVFLKWLIGGLRPHFLAVCQPDMARVHAAFAGSGSGFTSIYFRPDICTGDIKQIRDSLESFPSGHTTAAFAGFGFLSIYLNAKLKVFSNYHPALWKLIAVYAPILGATLIGGALTIDEFHNWYDVVAGGIIGTIFAFSSYRMMYASVWDFRFNHIPLARQIPFTFGAGGAGAFQGFHDTMFTRSAGWGHEDSFAAGGAPFDASSSAGMGSNIGTHNGLGGKSHHGNGAGLGHHGNGAGLGHHGNGAGLGHHSNGAGLGHHGNGAGNGHSGGILDDNHRHSGSVGRKPVGGPGLQGEHIV